MNDFCDYISFNQWLKPNTKRSLYVILLISLLLILTHYPNRVVSSRNFEMTIRIVDQSKACRPISGAMVSIINIGSFETNTDGYVLVNVPAGVYDIIVRWKSIYNPKDVLIALATIILDKPRNVTIPASVYDVELQVITPLGRPIVNANISLASIPINVTSTEGKVNVTQVPNMYLETNPSYPVTVIWFGVDISPDPVMITSTKTYILMAKYIADLTLQVVGAQGQGLSAAQVEIKNNAGMVIFNGISNEQGIARVEVPWGHYNITIKYMNSIYNTSVTINSRMETVQITTDIFIVIFGQAMTFATFIIMIVIISLFILVILVIEYYLIKRREKKKREVKICPLCGEKLELSASFCTKCGTHQLVKLEENEER